MTEMRCDVDDLDRDAIYQAVTKQQLVRYMPDGASDMLGRTIAEICRGWMDGMDRLNRQRAEIERLRADLMTCDVCGFTWCSKHGTECAECECNELRRDRL